MNEQQSGGMILAQLVESCTRGTANGGVGAVFALDWREAAALRQAS